MIIKIITAYITKHQSSDGFCEIYELYLRFKIQGIASGAIVSYELAAVNGNYIKIYTVKSWYRSVKILKTQYSSW